MPSAGFLRALFQRDEFRSLRVAAPEDSTAGGWHLRRPDRFVAGLCSPAYPLKAGGFTSQEQRPGRRQKRNSWKPGMGTFVRNLMLTNGCM